MQEQLVNQMREGMTVEDADGDKIGTVAPSISLSGRCRPPRATPRRPTRPT